MGAKIIDAWHFAVNICLDTGEARFERRDSPHQTSKAVLNAASIAFGQEGVEQSSEVHF
jgi:hypothetical protein